MNFGIITQEDVLVTPPAEGCLGGITMERILELIPEVRTAGSCFCCRSFSGQDGCHTQKFGGSGGASVVHGHAIGGRSGAQGEGACKHMHRHILAAALDRGDPRGEPHSVGMLCSDGA